MLVLSRHIGEVIMIGDNIKVCILDIRRGVVRVGLAAPKAVPIHREEVFKKISASDGQQK